MHRGPRDLYEPRNMYQGDLYDTSRRGLRKLRPLEISALPGQVVVERKPGTVYDPGTGETLGHFFDGDGFRDVDTGELFYHGEPVEDDGVGGFASLFAKAGAKIAAKKLAKSATKSVVKTSLKRTARSSVKHAGLKRLAAGSKSGLTKLAQSEEGQGMLAQARSNIGNGRLAASARKFKFRRRWLTTRLAPAISIKVRSGYKVTVQNVGTREAPVWQVKPVDTDTSGFILTAATLATEGASMAVSAGKKLWEQEQEIKATPWLADLDQDESIEIGAVLIDTDGYTEEM